MARSPSTGAGRGGRAATPRRGPGKGGHSHGAARGETSALSGLARVGLAGDGAVSIHRGGAVETVRNTAEGPEQSWSFARRPAGHEDLVVRLRASGLACAGETGRGIHFADPRTG